MLQHRRRCLSLLLIFGCQKWTYGTITSVPVHIHNKQQEKLRNNPGPILFTFFFGWRKHRLAVQGYPKRKKNWARFLKRHISKILHCILRINKRCINLKKNLINYVIRTACLVQHNRFLNALARLEMFNDPSAQ